MMFAAIIFPVKLFYQELHSVCLIIIYVVKQVNNSDPLDEFIIHFSSKTKIRKLTDRLCTKLLHDIIEILLVLCIIVPHFWQDAFSGKITTTDNKFYPVFGSYTMEGTLYGNIGRGFCLYYGSF